MGIGKSESVLNCLLENQYDVNVIFPIFTKPGDDDVP